jgi:hypothetical protein
MSERLWLLVAVLVIAEVGTALGDWKSDVARRAIGRAAQAGIEAAVRNAVEDAAYDAAMSAAQNAVVPEPAVPVPQSFNDLPEPRLNAPNVEVIGVTASAAAEAGMIAANVASAIDTAQDVADAARTVRKVNDVRKAIKVIRR